jgi:hypothetical protein
MKRQHGVCLAATKAGLELFYRIAAVSGRSPHGDATSTPTIGSGLVEGNRRALPIV